MLWALPVLPLVAGAGMWAAAPGRRGSRLLLGAAAVAVLLATAGLAAWAAAIRPESAYRWGSGLSMYAELDGVAGVVAVLVPVVAAPVVAYAVAHEDRRGLGRLLGLLVVFVGAMELLVVAADLLTLLVGWELVGAVSWALIGHEWWRPDRPSAAAQAFNVTRFGDLGLFLAAAATFAAAGSLRYDELLRLEGAALHVVVFGIVLAAAAKSAQVPFSPWLFAAMAGPTPVSALLHAATMVAAGAFLLARLQPALDLAAWFGPAVVAIGLVTALAGGVVAALQPDAKKLLAASTSAQFGLMFVAVGAGSATAAITHLVAHAAFKALLFLAAGIAIAAVGSGQLGRMRLGSRLPVAAALTAVGGLALAGVPPLGGAWTKEQIAAAAGEASPWGAVLVAVAGALSAFYATRFVLLAYGPVRREGPREVRGAGRAELGAVGALAAMTAVLGLLWVPGVGVLAARLLRGELPQGKPWEVVLSLALVVVGVYAAAVLGRRQRLATVGATPAVRSAADWLGLPAVARAAVVEPTLALCATLARVDDRVVDAGVRGAAAAGRAGSRVLSALTEPRVDLVVERLAAATLRGAWAGRSLDDRGVDGLVRALATGVGAAGRDGRRLQTGLAHHYYVVIAAGLAVAAAAAAFWR